jgi:hypothetical protein
VQWAAYLTAATRIELHRQLRADGQDGATAVYCDTDSVYASEPRSRALGASLGTWGYEGPMHNFVCVAPKVYRYVDQAGETVTRAKGLSNITPDDFEAFMRGESVTRSKGVYGLRSAARKGTLFLRKSLERSSHADGLHFGDRLLADDGRTYPQTLERLEEWECQRHRKASNI